MEDKVFLKLFSCLLVNLFLFGTAYGGDILLQEGTGEQAIIYRVSPDGNSLKEIGHGLYPQWSPDKKFISYIGIEPENIMELVVVDTEGKKVFKISETKDMGFIIRHSWNPEGKGIAFVNAFGPYGSSVSYYNLNTKKMKTLHKVKFKDTEEALLSTTLEWSPDGEKLLFSPGSIISKGQGVFLIDIKKVNVKKLTDVGSLPRFIGNEKLLFVIGSEIWTVNTDGSNKIKLHDMGISVLNLTKASGKKIIFLLKPKDLPREFPYKLILLNLENNKFKEIKTEGYIFLCPEISPDGDKFAAVRMKLKDGQPLEEEVGYYVYDLRTKEMTLLKKIELGKGREFWFNVYLGGKQIIWN